MKVKDGRILGSITVDGEILDLVLMHYADGRPAVRAVVAASGEPYGTLSVNPGPDVALPEGAIAVKTWWENAPWWGIAALSGIFLPTGETLNLGNFGSVAPVWRLADFAEGAS